MINIDTELSTAFNKAGLTVEQRIAVASYLMGESLDNIAKSENVSISAIKQRIKAARERYEGVFGSERLLENSIKHGLEVIIDRNLLDWFNNLTDEAKEAFDEIGKSKAYKAISYSLGVSPSAIKQRVNNARAHYPKKQGESISRIGLVMAFKCIKIYENSAQEDYHTRVVMSLSM